MMAVFSSTWARAATWAVIFAASAPMAQAAVTIAEFTGYIQSGQDFSGRFGSAGAQLEGKAIRITFRTDDSVPGTEIATSSSHSQLISSGSSAVSAIISVDGQSYGYGPPFRPDGSLQFSEISHTLGDGDALSYSYGALVNGGFEYIDINLAAPTNVGLPADFRANFQSTGDLFGGQSNAFSLGYNYLESSIEQPDAYGSFVIENVSIQTLSDFEPMTFGLFVGSRDRAGETNFYNGDIAAQQLSVAFDALPFTTTELMTGDLVDGQGVSADAVIAKISEISSMMSEGDRFVLYVTGHGGSTYGATLQGIGDEEVHIGGGTSAYLWDDDLHAALHQYLGDAEKIVLIDACHGGGFWDSTFDRAEGVDFFTADEGDLSKLQNIAFLSSAPEFGVAKFSSDDGLSFLSKALAGYFLNARSAEIDPILMAAAVEDYLDQIDPFYTNKLVFEMGFGDASLWDRGSIQTQLFVSADFRGAGAVPEPATWALMIGGFALVGAALRRCRSVLA